MRFFFFATLMLGMTGSATWASHIGLGADNSIAEQVALRTVYGRSFRGGGLHGGK